MTNQAWANTPKYLVLGGGQHARLITRLAENQGLDIVGLITNSTTNSPNKLKNLMELHDQSDHATLSASGIGLIAGIASHKFWTRRRALIGELSRFYHLFPNIVDSRSVLSEDLDLNHGIQVIGNSFIQSFVRIGKWSIVNSGAVIEHDSLIGDFVHIAPGVTICGGVSIGAGTYIGAGSTIVEGIEIGDNVVIGAGSLVLKNVPSGDVQFGVPSFSKGRS